MGERIAEAEIQTITELGGGGATTLRVMRFRGVIAVAALAAIAGCGGSTANRPPSAAVGQFLSAVIAQRGAIACRELAPGAASQLRSIVLPAAIDRSVQRFPVRDQAMRRRHLALTLTQAARCVGVIKMLRTLVGPEQLLGLRAEVARAAKTTRLRGPLATIVTPGHSEWQLVSDNGKWRIVTVNRIADLVHP